MKPITRIRARRLRDGISVSGYTEDGLEWGVEARHLEDVLREAHRYACIYGAPAHAVTHAVRAVYGGQKTSTVKVSPPPEQGGQP